jgi:hypothetical protein
VRERGDGSDDPAVNRLQVMNKNLYKHLVDIEDSEELALRRQIEEIDLN